MMELKTEGTVLPTDIQAVAYDVEGTLQPFGFWQSICYRVRQGVSSDYGKESTIEKRDLFVA